MSNETPAQAAPETQETDFEVVPPELEQQEEQAEGEDQATEEESAAEDQAGDSGSDEEPAEETDDDAETEEPAAEAKPEFTPEQQAYLDKIVGKRTGEVQTRERVKYEQSQSRAEAADEENRRLRDELNQVTGKHNTLADAVNADEMTNVPEDLRKPVEAQAAAADKVAVMPTYARGHYTPAQAKEVDIASRSLTIKSNAHFKDPALTQDLDDRISLLNMQGRFVGDVITEADKLPNAIEFLSHMVVDEHTQGELILAANEAKRSENYQLFADKVTEIAGNLKSTPTPVTTQTPAANTPAVSPTKKARTESRVGRVEGAAESSDEIALPEPIDLG